MAYRREPFELHEWYHCYNRGVDKRVTFEDSSDYLRFIQLLYLANDTSAIDRNFFPRSSHAGILSRNRLKPIVAIGAYCIMPNHFHLLLKETQEGGISLFMHKLGTGYAMYFNTKKERVGNLFLKPFRSRHVSNDTYLKHVTQYIHLNPAELVDSGWKSGKVSSIKAIKEAVSNYPYSSGPDFSRKNRPENAILDPIESRFLSLEAPSIEKSIEEAHDYFASLR